MSVPRTSGRDCRPLISLPADYPLCEINQSEIILSNGHVTSESCSFPIAFIDLYHTQQTVQWLNWKVDDFALALTLKRMRIQVWTTFPLVCPEISAFIPMGPSQRRLTTCWQMTCKVLAYHCQLVEYENGDFQKRWWTLGPMETGHLQCEHQIQSLSKQWHQ